MIGYAFTATSKPKNSGRENLDDIVIEKKVQPVSAESWWPTAAREGFTRLANRLFTGRRPQSTEPMFQDVPVVKLPRPSNWDAQ